MTTIKNTQKSNLNPSDKGGLSKNNYSLLSLKENEEKSNDQKAFPLSKASTVTTRTDAFGHVISKGKKTYKVSFADQDKNEKLVEIIYINDNSSAADDYKNSPEKWEFGTPKKPIQPINLTEPFTEPRFTIRRPKKNRWNKENNKSLERITEKVDSQCCSIF